MSRQANGGNPEAVPDRPTMESVMKEVLEAGTPQLWALRSLNAVQEGRMTMAEMDVKAELLRKAIKIWKEAQAKQAAPPKRLTPEESEKAQQLLPRELDMNRPFLDQFEEAADKDPTGLIWRWIREEVYPNPDLMSMLRPPVGKVL
jgi:hypothetical protein